MNPTQQLALWADRLRDMSALGLHYAQTMYDRDRYQALQNIAIEMLALATHEPLEQFEPLRATIFARPTPLSVGDAAVIDDDGRILLIQRADNHLWAMPGGALEVGETPAAGAVREAWEEAGVVCDPVALVGVFDSRYCGTTSRHHLYQFLFLCRPRHLRLQPASHVHETIDVRWFAEDALPDALDPGHRSRIPEAFRIWRSGSPTYFDRERNTEALYAETPA
jgi:8-oxo-dGTP pyrophosphatase MutT (NUDIX family)